MWTDREWVRSTPPSYPEVEKGKKKGLLGIQTKTKTAIKASKLPSQSYR